MELTGESPLAALFLPAFRVNSYHHQGLKALGRGLKPVAQAPDGLVEAVVLEGHPLYLGVQWHPLPPGAPAPLQPLPAGLGLVLPEPLQGLPGP